MQAGTEKLKRVWWRKKRWWAFLFAVAVICTIPYLLSQDQSAETQLPSHHSGVADYSAATGAVSVSLVFGGLSGFAEGDTYANVTTIVGSTFDDWLFGDRHNNRILGGEGDDVLRGEGGVDVLIGGNGNDYLAGGGADGAVDIFRFDAGWGFDTITDFQDGEDTIDLSSLGTNFANLTVAVAGTNDSTISFSGNMITLLGVQAGEVDASDFVFK